MTTLRKCWRELGVFLVGLKALEAWIAVPLLTLLVTLLMVRSGRTAVSNFDLVQFFLSVPGLAYAGLIALFAGGLFALEQAGILLLANDSKRGQPRLVMAVTRLLLNTGRLVPLAFFQLAAIVLCLVPVAALGALVFWLFLTEHDIYFYLTQKPREFWIAAVLGAVLLLLGAVIAAALLLRWLLAVAIVVLEQQRPLAALRASAQRMQGHRWQAARTLGGWIILVLLLSVACGWCFREGAAWMLSRWDTPSSILLLLALQAAMAGLFTVLFSMGLGILTYSQYCQCSNMQPQVAVTSEPVAVSAWMKTSVWGVAAFLILPPLAAWLSLPALLETPPLPKVTAHRGHSKAAPENTLAALRRAIASGADYAEIDVQLSRDQQMVLLHDRDLQRVAGDSRRLSALTLAEAQSLDVGSWFGPAFLGERIPTLQEAIALCRGNIRLNIELKIFGGDRRVSSLVAELLRRERMEGEVIVTSLDLEALELVQAAHRQLRVGLIVGKAVGDLSRVKVEALSVSTDILSDRLLANARRRGLEVHVWTVKTSAQATQLLKQGVDNIIASDPDLVIAARNAWATMTLPERLAIASRLLLGLEP